MTDIQYDVIIVGSGCSGLSAAQSLSKHKILILEKENYIGGRIKSLQIDNFNVETGALFPILANTTNDENSDSDFDSSHAKNIRYISPMNIDIKGNSIIDILSQTDAEKLSLKKFQSQNFIINQQLGLKHKNPSFGNLDILSEKQRQIIQAVYQVTHSGLILNCSANIRPLTLANITFPCLAKSNQERLIKYFPEISKQVCLNNTVTSITSDEDECIVSVCHNGNNREYRSKYVLVSSPPPSIFDCIKNINMGSLNFYSNIIYQPGTVCILRIHGSQPEDDLIINSHEQWSAAFISKVCEKEYILHIYIPYSRQTCKSDEKISIKSVFESITSYLPLSNSLISGIIENWQYLSPSLHHDIVKKYIINHFKLTNKIWYCGELALYKPNNEYTFGTNAAIAAGSFVGKELDNELTADKSICLEGLFHSDSFKISEINPTYINSLTDGNIAYYGIILSAFKQKDIADYLIQHSKHNQWEFHQHYGPTLDDSLLVIEGLADILGVKDAIKLFDVEQYLSCYFLDKEYLFTTTKNGCSEYWHGPSINANSHMLYILNLLNINHSRVSRQALICYLIKSQNANNLWSSKWFTNDFYTSFYVIRALVSSHDCSNIDFDKELMISCLSQILHQLHSSHAFIISKVYIVRSLLCLISSFKEDIVKFNQYNSLLMLCRVTINEIPILSDADCSENLLYYWQDVTSGNIIQRVFTISKPRLILLSAMVRICNNELNMIEEITKSHMNCSVD